MTKEEIAELRRRDDAGAEIDQEFINLLGRALDEREALLTVASHVADSIRLFERTPDEQPTTETLAEYARMLREAIAKAEGSAAGQPHFAIGVTIAFTAQKCPTCGEPACRIHPHFTKALDGTIVGGATCECVAHHTWPAKAEAP